FDPHIYHHPLHSFPTRRSSDLKAETLTSLLYEAKANAEHKQVPQLLSWTKRIDLLNIMDVFRRAKQTNQNRFFWMNHTNDFAIRSEEHTSELQSRFDLVCRLLL